MTTRTNQGGSIVTFIIIGAVLLVGLGAGIYYLANRSSDTPPAEEPGISAPQSNGEQSEPAGDIKTDETPAADESPTADEGQVAKDSTTEQPAEEQTPDELATAGHPAEMPQTGAGSNFAAFLGAALLSFATFAYVRSLRSTAETN